MNQKKSLVWFLFGLGSQLQIIASLSFTELFVFIAAPFIFLREKDYMRRNGIMPFFWLSMLVVVGCVVACIVNHTQSMFILRGMAVTCLLPCTVVVGHWMLRRDMEGFKWFLLGIAISSLLCTFVFQKSVEVTMLAKGDVGKGAVDDIISGPTYWIRRLNIVLNAIPQGWYLQCPMFFAMGIPLFVAAFAMLTSTSGRSTALGAIGATIILLIGGKKRETIRRRLCNKFGLWCCIAIVSVFSMHTLYRVAATQGWLGEEALQKYENQTRGDDSLGALLLGGRLDSFAGLIACVDNPIIGIGPWPEDKNGYTQEFLSKYGNSEDYQNYINTMQWRLDHGIQMHMIPCHAYLTEFWCWYGIFGLLFWLYVMFVFIRYLRQDCWAVPQWFMWLAASIPSYLWGVFFSPWSDRIGGIVFVVACLMARAVRQGRMDLPYRMIQEIEECENKSS